MPIGMLEAIIGEKPKGMRLLGLDIGTKTIGLAISNEDQTIATPLQTIARTKFAQDIAALGAVIETYAIGGYVLGWPLNMDGSAGASCDRVRSFADEMMRYPAIVGKTPWIALWDERLSTAAVDDFLIESADISRTRRKQVVDKLAAQHILQGALDYCSGNSVP